MIGKEDIEKRLKVGKDEGGQVTELDCTQIKHSIPAEENHSDCSFYVPFFNFYLFSRY